MKIVSEDHENSNIAKLYKVVYGDDVVMCNGSGNIEKNVDSLIIENPDEEIVIYIDLIPGNIETKRVFGKIRGKYKKYSNIYIIPIICAEYSILLSWFKYGLLQNVKLKEIIVDYEWYGNFYNDDGIKSIEGFCKRVIGDFTRECCKVEKGSAVRYYFDRYCRKCNDCPCLEERSVDFFINNVAFLANDITRKYCNSNEGVYEDILRQILLEYNDMCDTYGRSNPYGDYRKFDVR